MKTFFTRALFASLLLFFCVAGSQPVLAIGLFPAGVKINNITNGMTVKRTVFLSRENASKDQYYQAKVSGEGAKYLEFPEEFVKFPQGANSVAFDFFVKPISAPNGTYHIILDFEGITVDDEGNPSKNSVSVMPGVALVLSFEITDQEVKNFSVSNVYAENSEVGQPVAFYFNVTNNGNVDAKPERIVVKIASETDPTSIQETDIALKDLDSVGPSQTSKLSFLYRESLKEGTYRADVEIYADGRLMREEKNILVRIFPPGTMHQEAEFSSFELNGVDFALGEYVKLVGKIKNTGNIPIEPSFYIEIKKDGKIIDILREDPKILLRNQETDYELSYQINETGDYEAQAHFEYGISKTEKKKVEFFVKEEAAASHYVGYIIIILIILLLLILIIKKMIGKDDDEYDEEDDDDYDDQDDETDAAPQDKMMGDGPNLVG